MKKSVKIISNSHPQQVGDGFVGKNAFHPQNSKPFSPFLLLDHHGPMDVLPSERPKGVDQHPHRGFETVTVVYEGALEHRDSEGNYGKLFAGDVQWMTAASGIVHEEKHEKEFSLKGGVLEFVQLWINLPAAYKMNPPNYQELVGRNFEQKEISEGVVLRIIAGELDGLKGIAHTFSPIILADAKLQANKNLQLNLPENYNFMVYALKGEVLLNDQDKLKAGQLALFEIQGNEVEIKASADSFLLLMGGEVINEPLATYGPFVMNNQQELIQAFEDYQAGKMGSLN